MSCFKERINDLFRQSGKTQKDFARDVADVSRQSLYDYLNGNCIPDGDTIRRICEKMGVSADWLLGLSDVQSPNTNTQAINNATGLSEQTISLLQFYVKHDELEIAHVIDTLLKYPILLNALWEYFNTHYESLSIELPNHEVLVLPVENAVLDKGVFSSLNFKSFEPLARLSIMDMLKEIREESLKERSESKNGKS